MKINYKEAGINLALGILGSLVLYAITAAIVNGILDPGPEVNARFDYNNWMPW